jgi:hypothetical protein
LRVDILIAVVPVRPGWDKVAAVVLVHPGWDKVADPGCFKVKYKQLVIHLGLA